MQPEPESCVARLVLAYDGTSFHGWQVQPGLRTVQGELLSRLRRLVPIEGIPPGAGRTDAGVHARGQVCSIPLADETLLARLRRALPRMLPPDVALHEVVREPPGFHARFSATGRRYRYRFQQVADPFRRYDHLRVAPGLDLEAMRRAAADLVGDHDATSLCRTASLEPGRTRSVIRRAYLEWEGDTGWFEIEADRFLHSMVRIIVGTLLEIGRGRRSAEDLPAILAAKDRSVAGPTAPAHGLCLEEVEYAPAPPGEDSIPASGGS